MIFQNTLFKKYIHIVPFLVLVVLSLVIIWPTLQPGYFPHHDDLQVMRVYEMRKCFEDLQIPCRWVPDMGYGNGFPLFNYYPVFPYYVGAVLSYLLGFVGAAKALFFIPLVLAGIFMYLLAQELFGKTAGLVTSVLYMYAPYRALDSYVRGAVAESFAITIIPIVFYFSLRLSKEKKVFYFLGLVFSLAAFLLSHNIMVLFFTPLLLFWIIYLFLQRTSKAKNYLIAGVILGFGIASFFLLPAFFEKDLVQTETLTASDLDFRVHFVTIWQLFIDRDWGYGASVWGSGDSISFQVGWPHWWLALAAVIGACAVLVQKPKRVMNMLTLIFALFIVFLFSLFMTHNRSSFIWEEIRLLHFVQFPWRFLAVSIFASSLLGGGFLILLKDNIRKIIGAAVIVITVFLNFHFFAPESIDPNVTDTTKLSGKEWETQQKASILDYLPKTAHEPKEPATNSPVFIFGEGVAQNFKKRSNSWEFTAKISKPSRVEVPVFNFPGWKVFLNGKETEHRYTQSLGRIAVDLEKGEYIVSGRFYDTQVRQMANMVSLLALVCVVFAAIYLKKAKVS